MSGEPSPIVVAGEALVDLVIDTAGTVTAKLGGGPYNTARTIGRLGLPVGFLGAISTDRFGRQLFAALGADGVSDLATVRTDLPTTLAAAELDDRGAATYHFYFAGTSAPALDHIPVAAAAPVAVHAGTLGLVLEPMATTLLGYLRSLPASTTVMVDPNCRPAVVTNRPAYAARVAEACRRADVVKISTDDAEFLAPGNPPLEFARALLDLGPRAVLLTAGGDGVHVVCAEGERMVPTQPITVADTIGAGDSFGGGFLAYWVLNGRTREQLSDLALVVEATEAAQEVSAITCQRVGADPPRRGELSTRWRA